MSTKFISHVRSVSLIGTSSTISIVEGEATVNLPLYQLTATNFISTLTLRISLVSGNIPFFSLTSSGANISNVSVIKQGNDWIVSSFDHAALNRFIASMTVQISDDMKTSVFAIQGSNEYTQSNTLLFNVNVEEVVDAENIVQTRYLSEDARVYNFNDHPPFLSPQINDQGEQDTGKQYQVTLSPWSPSDAGKYLIYVENEDGIQYSDTVTFTGTQTEVNMKLASVGNRGLHYDFAYDVNGSVLVKYEQKVISGAPGAPYIQEIGQFNFVIEPDVDDGATVVSTHDIQYFRVNNYLPLVITDSADSWPANQALYRVDLQFYETIDFLIDHSLSGTWDEDNLIWSVQGTKNELNTVFSQLKLAPNIYTGQRDLNVNVLVYRSVLGNPFSLLKSSMTTVSLLDTFSLSNVYDRFYNEDIGMSFSQEDYVLYDRESHYSLSGVVPISITTNPTQAIFFDSVPGSGIVSNTVNEENLLRLRVYVEDQSSTIIDSLQITSFFPRVVKDTNTAYFNMSWFSQRVLDAQTFKSTKFIDIVGDLEYINNNIKSGLLTLRFFDPDNQIPIGTQVSVVYELTDILNRKPKCSIITSTITRI